MCRKILNLVCILALVSNNLFAQATTNEEGDCPQLQRATLTEPTPGWPDEYQVKLGPQEATFCMQTADGFIAELYASEEGTATVTTAQALAFDAKGRLWVAETFDYPNNITHQFEGNDHIKILEDTNGDGMADKQTIFVDGLNMPQSIAFVPGGVLVVADPHIVLFTDQDGNDMADDKEGTILYTVYRQYFEDTGIKDMHSGINSLMYGMDNMLYFGIGWNGGQSIEIRSAAGETLVGTADRRIYRAALDGSAVEQIGFINCNGWAMGQNEEGQIFYNKATCGSHNMHAIFPDAEIRINNHGSPHVLTDDVIQDGVPSTNHSYTAVSNNEIYTARYYPEDYWNTASFIQDGTVHLTHTDFLTRNNSTWTATERDGHYNLLASEDAWHAPVMAKVGPDGAVWIVDWYNYIFLHNKFPIVQETHGLGNALRSELRDQESARIYRVLVKDNEPDPIIDISNYSSLGLLNTLGHSNMLYRLHAQRLLIEKGSDAEIEARLEKILTESRNLDDTDLDALALHALWTAQGLGLFVSNPIKWDPILKDLLLHPSHSVRQNVVKAMPRTLVSATAIKEQGRLNDPDAHVRLQVMLNLKDMPDPSGLLMFADYRNLDAHSQRAFNEMGKGSEVGTLPSIPGLNSEQVMDVNDNFSHKVVQNIGLTLGHRGKLILKAMGAPSGTLKFYTLKGNLIEEVRVISGSLDNEIFFLKNRTLIYQFKNHHGLHVTGKLSVMH